MTRLAGHFGTAFTLSQDGLEAWRATPEYLAAREIGIEMEALEFLQTLSVVERLERNDRLAALIRAARDSQRVHP